MQQGCDTPRSEADGSVGIGRRLAFHTAAGEAPARHSNDELPPPPVESVNRGFHPSSSYSRSQTPRIPRVLPAPSLTADQQFVAYLLKEARQNNKEMAVSVSTNVAHKNMEGFCLAVAEFVAAPNQPVQETAHHELSSHELLQTMGADGDEKWDVVGG